MTPRFVSRLVSSELLAGFAHRIPRCHTVCQVLTHRNHEVPEIEAFSLDLDLDFSISERLIVHLVSDPFRSVKDSCRHPQQAFAFHQ